jgi:hypothetical protein
VTSYHANISLFYAKNCKWPHPNLRQDQSIIYSYKDWGITMFQNRERVLGLLCVWLLRIQLPDCSTCKKSFNSKKYLFEIWTWWETIVSTCLSIIKYSQLTPRWGNIGRHAFCSRNHSGINYDMNICIFCFTWTRRL